MRIVVASLVVLLAFGAIALGQEPRLPSVTLPAALDRVLRDYERAWQARDAAALFAEDGFVLSNGRPPVRGRTAIGAAYTDGGDEIIPRWKPLLSGFDWTRHELSGLDGAMSRAAAHP